MITRGVAKRVLTIGCSYKYPRGGVASVMNVYSRFIYPKFRCIVNSGGGGKLQKFCKAMQAYAELFFVLMFDKSVSIVHIHTASYNSFYRSAYFVRLAKMFHRKVVLHVHGGGFKEYYATSSVKISRILDMCDVIVVLSGRWKEFFQGITSSEVTIVHNVIEPPEWDGACRERKKGMLNLLFLGLIAEPKGVFDLVSTIGENQEFFRGKVILNIGGNGDTHRLGEMISKYGIDDIVQYHGWVSGAKKKALLKESDVYVLPSYAEGVPISILEAMSYRMAIVSTPVGGIPEIVVDGENGYLVPPGDHETLFAALKSLACSETKHGEMGAISYVKVQSHLPVNVEKELMAVYEKLLGQ